MAITLNDIQNFIVVCDTLNITRASEIIGMTQPALSYSIKRLEADLGGQLLIRLKNGIQLTKLGEEFGQRARVLVHEWRQAQNLANPELGLPQGSYTIAMHPSVALCTTSQFMPAIQAAYPGLNFKFTHGLSREMTEKVINWEADFGVVVNPIKHPDLVILKLYTDEVAIFHAGIEQGSLIFDEQLTQSQYILKKLSSQINFTGTINSPNLEVLAALTAQGVGYGVLPTRVAERHNNLKRLSGAPIFKDEICLVYRPEKHNNPVSQAIIRVIKSAWF